jgi:carboxymethylenebutenolidase
VFYNEFNNLAQPTKEMHMSATQPDGYLALPASGKGKPVLVLHAWWGLNSTIKALCDRLAGAGFVAFAADLYHGKVTDQISEAEKLATALDSTSDQAKADVLEAVKFLKDRTGSSDTGVAVIGFSLGAAYAIDLTTKSPDITSAVIFYGTGPGDFKQSNAEFLGHFAENDPYEPLEYVKMLEAGIKEDHRPVTFYVYSGTGHWFFEPDRADAYNADAATLAWERTLAFLNR